MQKLLKAIKNFTPTTEQESVDKDLFLKYARKGRKSLTRESIAHFTASAFVINESRTKVVCAYHNQYKSWCWLGGHADGDEDLLAVVKKEIQEECGITNLTQVVEGFFTINTFGLQAHIKRGKYVHAHVHLDACYVFVANENDPIRIKPDENSQVAWLAFDELLQKTNERHMVPIYKRIIDKLT